MMTGPAVAFLLSFLLSQAVNGLNSTAKCLPGFEWMFNSFGQSPCDVAADLVGVCTGLPFDLLPLPTGFAYLGPSPEIADSCRCSSVFYSLLCACAYCQGRTYFLWSEHITNCSTFYISFYKEPIPVGVEVPAYAYQNVTVSNTFNITLAISMTDPSSSSTPSNNLNIPAIVGSVVGGLVGLGLVAGALARFLLRPKRNLRKPNSNTAPQQDLDLELVSNTTPSLFPPMVSPVPGSPEDAHDLSDYSPSMGNFYRQNSPPFRRDDISPSDTGNNAQN